MTAMTAPATHREVVIAKTGAAETLSLREGNDRAPGADEIAIDVAYSGINFADIMMRLGMYPDAPKRPFVPGYEVSGIVRAIGSNVRDFAVGDRVMAGCYFGGYAARVTIPASQAFKVPAGIELDEAAGLPVAFFTAYVALVEMARVRQGDKVLIDCATGGVGTIAMQIAIKAGAEVVGLTSSPNKKKYVEGYGARAMTHDEFRADTSLKGFDVVLNSAGGRSINEQRARMGFGGRIVCFGVSGAVKDGKRNIPQALKTLWQTPRFSVLKLFETNQGIFALNALKIMEDPAYVAKLTKELQNISSLGLHAHIGKTFPADDVAGAHKFLESRGATGKVLLKWN